MRTNFALRIREQVERLKQKTLRTIESEVSRKRVTWFKDNFRNRTTISSPSPRQGYEMIFLDYMGLSEKELPVVRETESEIVWLSANACPTLEACKELGMDTRSVCRAVYEKSTQALLSQLDPQLRFLRSYEEIRPYARHCREMIVRINFERMMQIAVAEARISKDEGNKGYGSVVAMGSHILSAVHDTAITEKDPSLHAEVNAIRQAAKAVGDTNLSSTILFSTCEPCPMCSSLAVWTNITTIVYGISIEETARLGKTRILLGSREIVEKSPVMIEVIGDVLKEQCIALYS